MLFHSDSDDFPMKCPGCKKEFHEKIEHLKSGNGTRCPDVGCQMEIGYSAENFASDLKQARENPRDYYAQFSRIRFPE